MSPTASVRGDDPLRIKQRAGHRGIATTEMYIRDAENLAAGFGEVFPELPEELIGGTERSAAGSNERSNEKAAAAETIGTSSGTRVEQRGIEPRTSALRTQRSPS